VQEKEDSAEEEEKEEEEEEESRVRNFCIRGAPGANFYGRSQSRIYLEWW
jgi:hypothetical protein